MDKIAQSPSKILIIQLRRIGDVVFTLPVIDVLRRILPQSQIDFLVEPPSDVLVSLNKNVNHVWVYDKERPLEWIRKVRRQKYDAVLDFHSNGRTLWITALSGAPVRAGFAGALNRNLAYNRQAPVIANRFIVDQKIDLLKVLVKDHKQYSWDWKWDLKLPHGDMEAASRILESKKISVRPIGFAPVHRHPIRSWHADQYAETADRLIQKGHPVLMLCGPGEKAALEAIRRKMKQPVEIHEAMTLMELCALTARCRAFLANDNGPQKIAMALNVPSLTIFGPTNPLTINLNRKPHLSIRDETLHCIACERKICPYRHECMTHVTPDAVLDKLITLVNG